MWILTLGQGKARQSEFLREAERWHRYVEAKTYLSARSKSNKNSSRNPQSAQEIKLESAICVDFESYNQCLSVPHQFEDVSVASDD